MQGSRTARPGEGALLVAALATITTVTTITFFARPARALDAFEIQVYDGEADEPGNGGLELHVNRVLSGVKTSSGPELPPDQQSHFTLEPSFGLLPFWEAGCYFQTALRKDGTFDYAGAKIRSKFVTPHATGGAFEHVVLGVNVELSIIPERYEANRFGGEIRPIATYEDARWKLVANPILGLPWAGPDSKYGPTFEPAVMAKVKIAGAMALGVEYYADFGPLASPAKLRDEQHYVFEAVDVIAFEHVEINAGIGEGLTPASNGFVAKMILGYEFEIAPGMNHENAGADGDRSAARRLPGRGLADRR